MSVSTLVKSIQDIMRQDVGVDGDAQRISQLCWMLFLKIIDDQDRELELLDDCYRSPISAPLRWRNWGADSEGITGKELLDFVDKVLFPQLKELPIQSGPRASVVRDVFEDTYNYMKSGQLLRQVVNKINEIDFNNLIDRQHFGDIYEQIIKDLQSAGNSGEYYTPRALTTFMARMVDPKPGETLLDPACGTGGFLTCAICHMRERYVKRPEDEERMQASLRAVEKKPLPHTLAVTNMLLHGIEDPSFLRHDNTLARPYISWGRDDRVDIVLTNPPFGGSEEDGIESNFPQHFQTRETADLFLALIIRLLKPGGRAAVVLPDGFLFGEEDVQIRLKEHLMKECNLHTIVRLPNSVFKPYTSIRTNLLFFEKGEPTRDVWFWEHLVPEGQKAYSKTRPIRMEHLDGCADWWGGMERTGREEGDRAWRVSADEIKARGYNLDIKNPHVEEEDPGDPEALLEALTHAEEEVVSVRDQLRAVLTDRGPVTMNAAHLLALYDRVVDTPDAVRRLRRFVLDLAVRGRLVEQDPADEPASELLKRIEKGKGQPARFDRARRSKPLPLVDPRKVPFELPTAWQWVYFGNIVEFAAGRTPARKELEYWDPGEFPWVSIADMVDGETVRSTKESVSVEARLNVFKREPEPIGTMIMSFKLTIGKIAKLGIPAFHNEAIISIWPSVADLDPFLFRVLPDLARSTTAKGAVKGATLNRQSLSTIMVPLPPMSEQRRIVDKIDELMGLCDRLEGGLDAVSGTRSRLLDALVHESLDFHDVAVNAERHGVARIGA